MSELKHRKASAVSETSAAAAPKSSKSPKVPASALGRWLWRLHACVQAFGILLVSLFLLHWIYSLIEATLVESELANVVRFVDIDGTRTMYFCQGTPMRATAWIVHGVGSSWILNTPPLFMAHEKLPGVQICSYARPGFGLTGGVANASDVVGTAAHLEALVTKVTPPNNKLVLLGHSYGGALVVQLAHSLRAKKSSQSASASSTTTTTTTSALVGLALLDAMPMIKRTDDAVLVDQYKRDAMLVVEQLKKLAVGAEVAALLGILRLSVSFGVVPRIAEALPHLPQFLHRVYRHEVSSASTYKSMASEVDRSNATSAIVGALLADAAAANAPLFDALPLLVVRATEFSVLPPPALAAWRRLIDADVASTLLSSRTTSHTLQGAGHMFFDEPSASKLERIVVDFIKNVL